MKGRRDRLGVATLHGVDTASGPARLVVVSGGGSGAAHPVPEGETVVLGRSLDCDFVVGGTDVSRRHARLLPSSGGRFALEDLGSSNGTFVNGQAVQGLTPVQFGDQITIGKTCVLLFTHFDSAEDLSLIHI